MSAMTTVMAATTPGNHAKSGSGCPNKLIRSFVRNECTPENG